MKERNERHQADQLMKLFQEVANHQPEDYEEEEGIEEKVTEERSYDEYVELDLLNLPPRREVHGQRKVRYSLSFSSPFFRLFFIIILIVVIVFILYYVGVLQFPLAFF